MFVRKKKIQLVQEILGILKRIGNNPAKIFTVHVGIIDYLGFLSTKDLFN